MKVVQVRHPCEHNRELHSTYGTRKRMSFVYGLTVLIKRSTLIKSPLIVSSLS